MSYGTLSKNPINHYNKIYYTIGRTTFEPIHVFKTNPKSESIAPAVCLTDSKKHLSEMNPPTAVIGSTANVMAKTNGNVMSLFPIPALLASTMKVLEVIFTLENGSIRQLLIWTLTIKVLIKTPNSVHLFA